MHGGIGMTDEHDIGLLPQARARAEMTFGDAAYHRDRFARRERLLPCPVHPGRSAARPRFPIEAGHVLMFARSIGDPNPVYADAEAAAASEAGIIAPPTFVQAGAQFDPDYALRPDVGRPWFGSGRTRRSPRPAGGEAASPAGGGGGARQAAAASTPSSTTSTTPRQGRRRAHRHRRRGETWRRRPRAGKLVFPRPSPSTATRTACSSSPPAASGCGPSGRRAAGEGPMPLPPANCRRARSSAEVVVEDLKRTQIVQYAGASGDYNPLHTDEVFATKVAGYPWVFAHGMLTMGLTGRMLTDLVGDGRLTRFGGRFTSQVWPGDDLTATAVVDAVREEDGGPSSTSSCAPPTRTASRSSRATPRPGSTPDTAEETGSHARRHSSAARWSSSPGPAAASGWRSPSGSPTAGAAVAVSRAHGGGGRAPAARQPHRDGGEHRRGGRRGDRRRCRPGPARGA